MILNNIEKTQEEINRDIANDFINQLNQVVAGTDNRIKNLATNFWANAEIINEALGTDAGKLFTLLGSLEALLAQFDPNYVPFNVPNEFTVNADGSIVIGEKKVVVDLEAPTEPIEEIVEPLINDDTNNTQPE